MTDPRRILSSSALPLLAACSAGFLWGTGALVVTVLTGRYGFSPESISFWRFAVGAGVLLAVFGRKLDWHQVHAQRYTVLIAGVAMAGYVLFWFFGIVRMGAAVPTLIALCLPPVIVTVIALLRGQDRLDGDLIVILAAALAGTFLLVFRQGSSPESAEFHNLVIGVSFSVASAVLYAGFSLISGRLSNALGAGPATTCLTVVAAVTMSLSALYRPLTWPATIVPQAWILYLGVVTAALALLAFSWGSSRITPTALTVATLIEPLTAVVLSAILLSQPLGKWQWLGGALLLMSIWKLGRRSAGNPGHPRQRLSMDT